MRVACKIIINGLTGTISTSLERILSHPLVRDEMVPAETCDKLLDELTQIDLRMLGTQDSFRSWSTTGRSVLHIVDDLVELGVITPEIWKILAKPDSTA